MANQGKVIHIDGLRQFRGDLKKLDARLPKMVRKVLNEAAQIVVDDARARMPRDTGAARKSIRVASTQNAARIKAGGDRAPYYGWLDYGGNHKHPRSSFDPVTGRFHQLAKANKATRKFIKTGRYLYPSLEDNAEKVHQLMIDGLADIAGEVWPGMGGAGDGR